MSQFLRDYLPTLTAFSKTGGNSVTFAELNELDTYRRVNLVEINEGLH